LHAFLSGSLAPAARLAPGAAVAMSAPKRQKVAPAPPLRKQIFGGQQLFAWGLFGLSLRKGRVEERGGTLKLLTDSSAEQYVAKGGAQPALVVCGDVANLEVLRALCEKAQLDYWALTFDFVRATRAAAALATRA
jgi:hypothetical protein